jgi:hypothetical protein
MGVKKQVWLVHDPHVVFWSQNAGEKVVGLVQVVPKIAEININWRLGCHSISETMWLSSFSVNPLCVVDDRLNASF